MTRSVLRFAAELFLFAALILAIASWCARDARATVIQGQVPAGGDRPDVSVLAAELRDGVELVRIVHPGESICYALLVQMGGMAGGQTSALSCIQAPR